MTRPDDQFRGADDAAQVGPKTHPADREWMPDDPIDMHAVELPGDPEVMLALMVEEYLRLGFDTNAILSLAQDPNYRAFHELYVAFGAEGFSERMMGIVERTGVMRFAATEHPVSDCCDVPEVIPLTVGKEKQ